MKNKQEIDCIFRKVRSFKKYVKCKRRDRVKAKMKPCITAHMTAFSLLLSFGKWAFFCLPTDCLHFCTRSFLPDPCFFASRVGHSHFVSRCKKVVLLMISDPTFAINFLQCFLTILQRRYSHRKVVVLKDLAAETTEKNGISSNLQVFLTELSCQNVRWIFQKSEYVTWILAEEGTDGATLSNSVKKTVNGFKMYWKSILYLYYVILDILLFSSYSAKPLCFVQ